MINLIFPDGSIVSGASFREVEDALRATQWHSFATRRAFRREMRRRARLWSDARFSKPIPYQTSKQFIYSLANSGMLMVEEAATATEDRPS